MTIAAVGTNFDTRGMMERISERSGGHQRPTESITTADGRSCVYCEARDVALEDDGPDRQCCVDTDACERRLIAMQTQARTPAAKPATAAESRMARPAAGDATLRNSYSMTGPIELNEGVRLPIEAAVTRYVNLGKSGAGKTNGDCVLAEEFFRNGVPVIILDVIGNMHGLRSNAAGDGPGIALPILGGRHGDLLLHASDAAALAQLAGQGVSMLLDLSLFNRNDQQRFAAAFFERLIQCIETPIHVIVEEADVFAPKRLTSKAQHESHTATTVFARYCRNSTVGWTFSTQRPALLAHDIVDTSSAFIAMQMTGDDAQDAIGREVKSRAGRAERKQIMDGLGKLERGGAYLVPDSSWLGDDTPESHPIRFRFRLRSTFDAARPLKIGERRQPPAVRADVDLSPFAELSGPDAGELDVPGLHEGDDATIVAEAPIAPRPDVRRRIVTELLRRPDGATSTPLLFALCDVEEHDFDEALSHLRNHGFVSVRRGRNGGISLTALAYNKLGIKPPSRRNVA